MFLLIVGKHFIERRKQPFIYFIKYCMQSIRYVCTTRITGCVWFRLQ